MKTCLFVYNPKTGGNRLKHHLFDILGVLAEAGYECTVHPTRGPGDAREMAAAWGPKFDLLVCCGGDGTLNETVAGLVSCGQRQPLLGYIPGGTTNDFAASLGLPRNDMLAAAKRIVQPHARMHCDLGFFGNQAFNYIAAFGAFTDVSYSTNQKAKDALGYLAYVLEAVGRLTKLPTVDACAECDGEVLEGRFIFGMITNSKSVGGFSFKEEHNIRLDDGLFELVLIRQPTSLADLSSLSGALVRRNLNSPLLLARHVREVKIFASQPINWTLDGEYGGQEQDIHIQVRPQAYSICV